MQNNALKISEHDNVVIATRDIAKDEPVVAGGQRLFQATEAVAAGHKISLADMEEGDRVFRYGEPIVVATQSIHPGEWVHTHNTKPIS